MSGGARRRIARATALLIALQALTHASGLLKSIVVAGLFGTSEAMDAYLAAMTVVGLILLWVSLPVTQTLIPMFRWALAREGEHAAWRTVSVLLNDLVVVFTAVTAAGMLLAPTLVDLVAPGFAADTAGLAGALGRLCMAAVLLLAIAEVLSQLYLCYERFLVPGAVGVADNLVALGVLLAVGATWGIWGLAVATVLGALVHLAVQFPVLWEKRRLYVRAVDLRHPGMREMTRLSLPLLVSTGGAEIARVTDRIFASLLAAGSLSALAYGHRLVTIPFDFLVRPLQKATFPHFTRLCAEGDHARLSRQLFHYLRVVFFVTAPAAVVVGLLAEPLVSVLYERGRFDGTSVRLTGQALACYAVGLPALAVARILNRTFLGLKDTRTPTAVSLGRIGVKVVLSWVLIGPLAHAGVALAESISQIVRAACLFALLPATVRGGEGWPTVRSFARTTALALGVGALLVVAGRPLQALGAPVELGVLAGLGGAAWGMVGLFASGEEATSLRSALAALGPTRRAP